MKKLIGLSLACLTLFISSASYAQEQPEEVKIKKKTYIYGGFQKSNYGSFRSRNTHFEGHWSGIGLGYSGLVSSIGNFSLPSDASFMSQKANSIVFDLNIYNVSIPVWHKAGFLAGIGMEVNNFKFDSNKSLKQNDEGYVSADDYGARGDNLEKSKLTTTYLNIPILFEVQLGKYSQAFINFGVIGAWRVQSHTKVISDNDGKVKNKKGLNMNNFRYGYMAQVGCNKIGVYAKYYPDSIFKNDRGPAVRQFNIGLIFYTYDLF